jgi:predicted RNA binding protein YcfA (HicA-like mRNA interferase family)
MSNKYPKMSGRELIKILGKFGFEVARIKGSHHFLKHPDARATVVPVHRGESIGPGLLHKISKDTEIEISKMK